MTTVFSQRRTMKGRFLKNAVIGFCFLSGLWVHLGFDPGNMVSNFLQSLLLRFDPQHEVIIKLIFFLSPAIITFLTMLFIYRKAGLWGLIAVGLAFLAGTWLDLRSIPLIVVALIIGFFAARR